MRQKCHESWPLIKCCNTYCLADLEGDDDIWLCKNQFTCEKMITLVVCPSDAHFSKCSVTTSSSFTILGWDAGIAAAALSAARSFGHETVPPITASSLLEARVLGEVLVGPMPVTVACNPGDERLGVPTTPVKERPGGPRPPYCSRKGFIKPWNSLLRSSSLRATFWPLSPSNVAATNRTLIDWWYRSCRYTKKQFELKRA